MITLWRVPVTSLTVSVATTTLQGTRLATTNYVNHRWNLTLGTVHERDTHVIPLSTVAE